MKASELKKQKQVVTKITKNCSSRLSRFCEATKNERLVREQGAQGIAWGKSINIKTGNIRQRLVYRHGRAGGDYIWLNYCPWCGGSVQ